MNVKIYSEIFIYLCKETPGFFLEEKKGNNSLHIKVVLYRLYVLSREKT